MVANPAKDGAAGSAGEGEQGRLGDELHRDVGAGGTEGTAEPDLTAPLQDGDHHDVGDPDAADEQGDTAQGQEQALERDRGVGARGERVGRARDGDVLRGGRVGGRGEHPRDGGHADRAGPHVDLHGGAARAEQAPGDRKADEGGAVEFGGERQRLKGAHHREPVIAEPDLDRPAGPVRAQGGGGAGAQHDRGETGRRRVEEPAPGQVPLHGLQQVGLRGVNVDRVGVRQRDPVIAVHVRVDLADRGGGLHRPDSPHHRGCSGRQDRLPVGERLPRGNREQVGAEGVDLGDELGAA